MGPSGREKKDCLNHKLRKEDQGYSPKGKDQIVNVWTHDQLRTNYSPRDVVETDKENFLMGRMEQICSPNFSPGPSLFLLRNLPCLDSNQL